MNKNILKQIFCLIFMGAFLVIIYFAGYRYADKMEESEIKAPLETEKLPEGSTDEEILDKKAELIIESRNLETDDLETDSEKLPVDLIGLSKSEVIDYITSHSVQFQESDETIKNISMISFSRDTLVIRKDVVESVEISETVRKNESEVLYNYYLVLENECIVVYKQDKTTVFLETGITVEDLDDDEKELLKQGIGVKNISELYRYLEGYTS